MRKPSFPIRHAACLSAVLSLGAAGARAGDLAYLVSVGGGQSDNVARVAEDPTDESIATAGLRLSFDQQSKRFNADIVGDFAYYDYLDNTYDPDLVGSLVADTDVALIEDRLKWTVHDNYGQVLGNPFVPSTPENRENVNYLDTGLQGTFAFGSQNRLLVGASYALATYELSPLDSDTLVGDVGLLRVSSPSTSLALRLRAAQVDYHEGFQAVNDYDQSEAFFQYSNQGSRTMLDASVGYTTLDRDVGDSDSGALLRLQLERRLSGMSYLTFGAGQEYSNSASAFASAQSDSVSLEVEPGRQTAAPFTLRYLNLGWKLAGRRTELELSAALQKQIYPNLSIFDQTLTNYRARVSRSVTPSLLLSLTAESEHGKFEQAGADYTDFLGTFSVAWQMSRRLGLSFSYDHSQRGDSALGGGYSENRLWLLLSYQRGSPRDSMRGAFAGEGE